MFRGLLEQWRIAYLAKGGMVSERENDLLRNFAVWLEWETAQQGLRERCENARSALAGIPLDDAALAQITERCFAAGVDGLRADLVWLRAARAHAAWRAAEAIGEEDIDAVAEFALRHRRREQPSSSPQQPAQSPENAAANQSKGQGQWGDMPAPALATGSRREIPSWPKKP